jgi:hypothetical protein
MTLDRSNHLIILKEPMQLLCCMEKLSGDTMPYCTTYLYGRNIFFSGDFRSSVERRLLCRRFHKDPLATRDGIGSS